MKNHKNIKRVGGLLLASALFCFPAFVHSQVIWQTDFSDYTLGTVGGQDNWTNNSTGTATADIIASGSGGAPVSPTGTNLLELIRTATSGNTPIARQTFLPINNAVSSGMVKFSYSMAINTASNFPSYQVTFGNSMTGNFGIRTGIKFETTGDPGRYLYIRLPDNTIVYLDADPGAEGRSPVVQDEFYRFDILLNIDTEHYKVSVFNESGALLDSTTWLTGILGSGETNPFNRIHVEVNGGSLDDTMYLDSMLVAIPEPASVATVAGLLALFAVCLIRLRRK